MAISDWLYSEIIEEVQSSEHEEYLNSIGNSFQALEKSESRKFSEEKKEMQLIPYSNIVGSLMYMMICTRPDIAHAISTTSRYMAGYGRIWQAALECLEVELIS